MDDAAADVGMCICSLGRKGVWDHRETWLVLLFSHTVAWTT